MNINKIQADREKAEMIISQIENYLDDNFAGDELLKSMDWLKMYIEDLLLEQELQTTLAQQEFEQY